MSKLLRRGSNRFIPNRLIHSMLQWETMSSDKVLHITFHHVGWWTFSILKLSILLCFKLRVQSSAQCSELFSLAKQEILKDQVARHIKSHLMLKINSDRPCDKFFFFTLQEVQKNLTFCDNTKDFWQGLCNGHPRENFFMFLDKGWWWSWRYMWQVYEWILYRNSTQQLQLTY